MIRRRSSFAGLAARWNSRTGRPQGALTETLGSVVTGFRKPDDALRKRRTNRGWPGTRPAPSQRPARLENARD
jgi:hypothetical protein